MIIPSRIRSALQMSVSPCSSFAEAFIQKVASVPGDCMGSGCDAISMLRRVMFTRNVSLSFVAHPVVVVASTRTVVFCTVEFLIVWLHHFVAFLLTVPGVHPLVHETSYITVTSFAFALVTVTEWFRLKSSPQSLVMVATFPRVSFGPMVVNVWSAQ